MLDSEDFRSLRRTCFAPSGLGVLLAGFRGRRSLALGPRLLSVARPPANHHFALPPPRLARPPASPSPFLLLGPFRASEFGEPPASRLAGWWGGSASTRSTGLRACGELRPSTAACPPRMRISRQSEGGFQSCGELVSPLSGLGPFRVGYPGLRSPPQRRGCGGSPARQPPLRPSSSSQGWLVAGLWPSI